MTQGTYHFDAEDPDAFARMKRRQEIAEAMLSGRGRRAPKSVAEGIFSAATDIAAGLKARSARKGLEGLRDSSSDYASEAFSEIDGFGEFPPSPDVSGSNGGNLAADVAYSGFEPHQKALLNTISGPESAGRYNVRYGGARFDGFGDHPRIGETITSGPNKGKKSTAAGRYQFIQGTWDDYARRMNLSDFSPKNQDLAAWELAKDTYRNEVGGDLDQALQSGDTDTLSGVGRALSGTWTSLPTGIESQMGGDRFIKAYKGNLGPRASLEASGDELVNDFNAATGRPAVGAGRKQTSTAREAIDLAFAQTGLDDSGQTGVTMTDAQPNAPILMASGESQLLPIIRGATKRQLDAMDPTAMSVEERAAATKRYQEIGDELESSIGRSPAPRQPAPALAAPQAPMVAPPQPQTAQPTRPITPTPRGPALAAPQNPVAHGGALPLTISPSMDRRMEGAPPLEAPRNVGSRAVAGMESTGDPKLDRFNAFAQRSGSQQLMDADPRKGILAAITGMGQPSNRPGFPERPGADQFTAENAARGTVNSQRVANAMMPTENSMASMDSNPYIPDSTKKVAAAMLGRSGSQPGGMQFASLDPGNDFRTALAQPQSDPQRGVLAAEALQGIPTPGQPANAPEPVQTAQARQLSPQQVRKLYTIMSNPAFSPGDRAMAQHLLRQHQASQLSPSQKQNMELRNLQMEKVRRDLNTQPERKMFKDANGRQRWADSQELVVSDLEVEPEFRDLTPEEIQARGNLDPEGAYQIGRDGRIHKVGGGGVTTNIDLDGESAWSKESAKLFAKWYDDLTTQAQSAHQMLGLYELAGQALESGLRTGSLGAGEQALRRMGLALGIGDAEKVAGGELITAVQNRMALMMRSPDSGMGMPGAVSDRDLTFLKEAQVGLDRTPEGNRRLLEAFSKMEQRKIEIAGLADNYILENGRLDVGFNKAVREYANANPLFPEKQAEPGGQTSDPLGLRN